jgi:hypothetical protein
MRKIDRLRAGHLAPIHQIQLAAMLRGRDVPFHADPTAECADQIVLAQCTGAARTILFDDSPSFSVGSGRPLSQEGAAMADDLANHVTFSFPPQGEPRAILGVTFTLAPSNLPAEVSHMLARVLERVPYTDRWQISNKLLFFVCPTTDGHYLSPELTQGRSVVAFGEGLLWAGNDDVVASILLPKIALAVLQARHACEAPMQIQTGAWLDPKTGKVTDERKSHEAAEEYRNAGVDLQIDVHFAEKEAAELAEQWNNAWWAAHPPEMAAVE